MIFTEEEFEAHLAKYEGLKLAARTFNELQHSRIKLENRANAGLTKEEKAQNRALLAEGNLGLTERSSSLEFHTYADAIQNVEEMCRKALAKEFRRVAPAGVVEWQKSTVGLGEHMLALLLGNIGHPRIATPFHWEEGRGTEAKRILVPDPPYERTVGQLWAYCGRGEPGVSKRRKGMTQEEALAMGNPEAKKLTYLISESLMKQKGKDSPYRKIYEDRRAMYDVREGMTPIHSHKSALNVTAKAMLKDLWIAAGKD